MNLKILARTMIESSMMELVGIVVETDVYTDDGKVNCRASAQGLTASAQNCVERRGTKIAQARLSFGHYKIEAIVFETLFGPAKPPMNSIHKPPLICSATLRTGMGATPPIGHTTVDEERERRRASHQGIIMVFEAIGGFYPLSIRFSCTGSTVPRRVTVPVPPLVRMDDGQDFVAQAAERLK